MENYETKRTLLECLANTDEMKEFLSNLNIKYEVILYKPCATPAETQDLIHFCGYNTRHLKYPHIIIDTIPATIQIDKEMNDIFITMIDEYEVSFDNLLKKYGEEYIHTDSLKPGLKWFVFSLLGVVTDKHGDIMKYAPGKHRALFVNNDNVKIKLCSGSHNICGE